MQRSKSCRGGNTDMLWYKGWLETRFRMLIGFFWIAWFLISEYSRGVKALAGIAALTEGARLIAAVLPIFVSGAGITTQPAFNARKGIHGSMLFTLSMPVSRFRLLMTRAGLGWLEMAATIGVMCSAMWILFPLLR